MALNNRTAKIGDQFKLNDQLFTVHTVSPAGSGGRSFAAGPSIGAWLRPGGYGVTIDESTKGVEWIDPSTTGASE